jgi:hypothetical protein
MVLVIWRVALSRIDIVVACLEVVVFDIRCKLRAKLFCREAMIHPETSTYVTKVNIGTPKDKRTYDKARPAGYRWKAAKKPGDGSCPVGWLASQSSRSSSARSRRPSSE